MSGNIINLLMKLIKAALELFHLEHREHLRKVFISLHVPKLWALNSQVSELVFTGTSQIQRWENPDPFPYWHELLGFDERGCGCPIPGIVPGQFGSALEQPGALERVGTGWDLNHSENSLLLSHYRNHKNNPSLKSVLLLNSQPVWEVTVDGNCLQFGWVEAE